jgi:hypothetical protein
VLPSELAARRIRGRSSSLLSEELLEPLRELPEELLAELEVSELDPARRSTGRSGSSIDELLELSEDPLREDAEDDPDDEPGCQSLSGFEALACSSGVPSRIIVMVLAR